MIVIHNLPLRSTLPVAFLNSQSLAFNNSALFGKMSIAMTSARHFMRNKSGLTEAIVNQAILPNFNDPYGCRFTYELKKIIKNVSGWMGLMIRQLNLKFIIIWIQISKFMEALIDCYINWSSK